MMYGSWDKKHDGQNFLLFWTVFCTFILPLTNQKIKILKKWKRHMEIYHFTQVYHKWQSCDVRFLRYQPWHTRFFVILDRLLPFYSPNNPKNQNFKKLKKTPWRYHHFSTVYQKSWSYAILFLRYGAWRM